MLGTAAWIVVILMTGVAVHVYRSMAAIIAALRRDNARLAESSGLIRAIFEHNPDYLYFKDRDSRFMHFSHAFLQHFHLTDEAMMRGKTDFDFFGSDISKSAREEELQIMRTGAALIGKVEKSPTLDGRVNWFLTTKMPWRDQTGAIIGTFGISKDITALKEAEEKVERMHEELLDASRQAGMAEVATGVLHNVGNVLNSVNVSATLVSEKLRHSKTPNLARLSTTLEEHKDDLDQFLSADPRGRMVPSYLRKLAEALAAEQSAMATELEHLCKNIDHIKDIVTMQQAYAKVSGIIETVSMTELIEDALRINAGSLAQHRINITRDYRDEPRVSTDKYKVMQILINLIRNAEHACHVTGRDDKRITVRLAAGKDGGVTITVADNGVGIPPENLTRIFNHGFTTRKEGHGFGLHSGALAAAELGGTLTARSDGPGHGATFILELPYRLVSELNARRKVA